LNLGDAIVNAVLSGGTLAPLLLVGAGFSVIALLLLQKLPAFALVGLTGLSAGLFAALMNSVLPANFPVTAVGRFVAPFSAALLPFGVAAVVILKIHTSRGNRSAAATVVWGALAFFLTVPAGMFIWMGVSTAYQP
jgi:hypothetical protein